MSKPDLGRFQSQFVDVMLNPEALPQFAAQCKSTAHKEDRIALYRGNLTALWNSALQQAYPVLYQLVGADFFEQMARAYGHAHPSLSGDLHCFGSGLPEFISTSPEMQDYPYFADVAALEWQIHRAYYAENAPVLTLAELIARAEAAGKTLQQACLYFHPAASLHASDWATVPVWHAHQESSQGEFPEDLEQQSFGLVARPDWQVSLSALTFAEWRALDSLRGGACLAESLDAALNLSPQWDVGRSLQTWFGRGIFSDVKFVDGDV